MEKEDIIYFIKGYANNTLSDAELHTFFNEVIKEENKEVYQEVAATLLEDAVALDPFDEKLWPLFEEVVQIDRLQPELKLATQPIIRRINFLRKWGWAAASVILFLGIGAYLWISNKKNESTTAVAQQTRDVSPGKDGAILTLADGSQVVLDSLGNGLVAAQNGSKVLIRNGELEYDVTGEATENLAHNTMRTPKGRQFNMRLADGTKVWLNAASSIRYPTVFAGTERRVEITGEVYFEVAKNPQMPFRVNVNNKAEVEVLGTHFNVNAYENENAINTTLLEGSVRVAMTSGQQQSGGIQQKLLQNEIILKPGQQAIVLVSEKTQTAIKRIENVDIDKVIAWKNGQFNFDGVKLSEIMRQIERWYDIEVVYEHGLPDKEFEGKMTRDVSLNGLLFALEKLGVHCKLEGRKLFILP